MAKGDFLKTLMRTGALASARSSDMFYGTQSASGLLQTWQEQEKLDRQEKQAAMDRLHAADQARAQRRWQTEEREAGQEFTTGERVAGQEYRTGERVAGQIFSAEEAEKGREHVSEEAKKLFKRQEKVRKQDKAERINAGKARILTALSPELDPSGFAREFFVREGRSQLGNEEATYDQVLEHFVKTEASEWILPRIDAYLADVRGKLRQLKDRSAHAPFYTTDAEGVDFPVDLDSLSALGVADLHREWFREAQTARTNLSTMGTRIVDTLALINDENKLSS